MFGGKPCIPGGGMGGAGPIIPSPLFPSLGGSPGGRGNPGNPGGNGGKPGGNPGGWMGGAVGTAVAVEEGPRLALPVPREEPEELLLSDKLLVLGEELTPVLAVSVEKSMY